MPVTGRWTGCCRSGGSWRSRSSTGHRSCSALRSTCCSSIIRLIRSGTWRWPLKYFSSRGFGLGHALVESAEEPPVAGGFFSPAAGFGVGEELLGVGALGGEDGQERGIGAEAGAVL